jgi:hypothetical protein
LDKEAAAKTVSGNQAQLPVVSQAQRPVVNQTQHPVEAQPAILMRAKGNPGVLVEVNSDFHNQCMK